MTGIILAGGRSSRLGQDKSFVDIGGQPLMNRVINNLKNVCEEIIIVTKKPERFFPLISKFKVKITVDLLPFKAGLIGIYSGMIKSGHKYNFVCGVDMPFISTEVIKYLAQQARGFDAAVPVTETGLEPLCAVYSRTCLKVIQEQIQAQRFKITDFFDKVKINQVEYKNIKNIDPLPEIFFNINTKEDLIQAEELINRK